MRVCERGSVWERECVREGVCELVRECVWVKERKREREKEKREKMWVSVRERMCELVRECVCERESVCERERECERAKAETKKEIID